VEWFLPYSFRFPTHFLQSVDLRGRMCCHKQSLLRRAFNSRIRRVVSKRRFTCATMNIRPSYENTIHGLNAIVPCVLRVPWSITNCSTAPIRMFCDIKESVQSDWLRADTLAGMLNNFWSFCPILIKIGLYKASCCRALYRPIFIKIGPKLQSY
jgi:hypothetical protein